MSDDPLKFMTEYAVYLKKMQGWMENESRKKMRGRPKGSRSVMHPEATRLARENGIEPATARRRIRAGWTLEDAVNTPARKKAPDGQGPVSLRKQKK